jgi:methionyl-tRNA formyltransferase
MNGDKQTGVTTFFIDDKIDTGNIILQHSMDIGSNETAGELHDRMIQTGSNLVVDTLDQIQAGGIQPIAQETVTDSKQRPAPKLFKENTRIVWGRGAKAVHNHVRGLCPYPAAWTIWQNKNGQIKQFKIFKTEVIEGKVSDTMTLWSDKDFIYVSYPDSCLRIVELQMEGKKRMSSKEWLVGNSISDWNLDA